MASADPDRISLTRSKEATLNRGWDVRPPDLETATVPAATTDVYGDTYVERNALSQTDRLAASRVATETGDVVAEDGVLDVPVTEERSRVERRGGRSSRLGRGYGRRGFASTNNGPRE